MNSDHITYIATYGRLCARPHNRVYTLITSIESSPMHPGRCLPIMPPHDAQMRSPVRSNAMGSGTPRTIQNVGYISAEDGGLSAAVREGPCSRGNQAVFLMSWMSGHSTAPFWKGKASRLLRSPFRSSANNSLRLALTATPAYPNPRRG